MTVRQQKTANRFLVYINDLSGGIDVKASRIFINEVAEWCKENFGNHYKTWNIDHSGCTFIIDKDEDLVAFKLRWL